MMRKMKGRRLIVFLERLEEEAAQIRETRSVVVDVEEDVPFSEVLPTSQSNMDSEELNDTEPAQEALVK